MQISCQLSYRYDKDSRFLCRNRNANSHIVHFDSLFDFLTTYHEAFSEEDKCGQ
jgi:hypothetical protein